MKGKMSKALRAIWLVLLPIVAFVFLLNLFVPAHPGRARAAGTPGNELIQIPLRWCAVQGSPAVANPLGVNEPDTDNVLWRRHERASDNIWIPMAAICFRSAMTAQIRDQASFPIIDDPDPPGTGRGVLGDIVIISDAPDGNPELNEALAKCETAWAMKFPDARGPVAINVRRFVSKNGTTLTTLGISNYPVTCNAVISEEFCKDPMRISSGEDVWLAVVDNSFLLAGDPHDSLLAHELGHILFLGHGDGRDNDMDRVYDSCCDPLNEDEYAEPSSLMRPTRGPETITELQKTTARVVARVIPGVSIDPPAALINADTVSDQKVDAINDVSAASVDIVRVNITENTRQQKTTFSHRLFGVIPLPISAQYVVFADLDGNLASGGSPSLLGFDTAFEGAELVTRVSVVSSNGVRTVVPTVWKFQSGAFVAVANARVRARVSTTIEAETNLELFDVVSIEVPNDIRGRAEIPLRIQALAQRQGDTVGTFLDRLPDNANSGENFFTVSPKFPVCEVTPAQVQKGGGAVVEVSGLLPNRTAKVILGDEMVATGPIDSAGNARISFGIPSDTREGARLLTVGVMGTALTADCSLAVVGSQGPTLGAPTLSEWGFIFLALLLMTSGTIFIVRRSPLITGSTGPAGGAEFIERIKRPLFVPAVFGRVLAGVVALIFIGFAVVTWLSGPIKLLDIGGTLLSGLVSAYVVHLLILDAKDSQTNRG